MLCFVFSGVDIVLVVGIAQVISFAAWRYRTSQNYTKCSVDRVREALDRGCICIQVKRVQLRICYVLMEVLLY